MDKEFAGFEDFDECTRVMTDEEGHDIDSADDICGALQAEAKADTGDPEALLDALKRGSGLIADVGVDLVSGVDVPAVNSKWTMFKSGGARKGHDWRADSRIVLKADDDAEKRISYAAAMIPREPDKEGDVVATPTVEKAAHDFLTQDGGVDTDHSLIDGDGDVVESWVLKEDRTFDLPDGGTESYGAGTWMVGIKWAAEAWERIQSGELTGLSIYGMAEHVPLGKAAKCADCGTELSGAKCQNGDTLNNQSRKSEGMGSETTTDDAGDGDADAGDGPTIDEVAASVDDLAETVADVTDTLSTVKDAVETEKEDARDAAALLAEEFGLESAEAVLDAVDEKANGDGDDEGEEEDDEDDVEASAKDGDADGGDGAETAEKRADDAHLAKGGDGRQTAAKGVESDGNAATGDTSWKTAKQKYDGGNQ